MILNGGHKKLDRSTFSLLDDASGLTIEIPAPKHPYHKQFYAIQIVVIAIAIPAVVCYFSGPVFDDLASGDSSNLILSATFCGSLVIGLVLSLLLVIYGFLWENSGVETVEVTRTSIQRRFAPTPLLGAKKQYDMKDVRRVRAQFHQLSEYKPFRQIDSWGFIMGRLPGQVAFDYRGSTGRIGNGLSEADATHLADIITSKFTQAPLGDET